MSGRCTWAEDSDGDWLTDCGHAFTLTNGKPAEHGMRYCCYCGAALVENLHSEEQDDELATD